MTWDESDTKAAIEFDKWLQEQKEIYYYEDVGEFFKEIVNEVKG